MTGKVGAGWETKAAASRTSRQAHVPKQAPSPRRLHPITTRHTLSPTALTLLSNPAALTRPPVPRSARCARCAGTRVPRVELHEMGPSMDLEVRRSRAAPPDLEKEASRQPKPAKKKVGG